MGRWSLDHPSVDQEGNPTLVEVKRSSNTQIRREVVGLFLGDDTEWEAAEPWQAVKSNLQAGRLRLVFVADRTRRSFAGNIVGKYRSQNGDDPEGVAA
jgi:hypothetical protein